MEVCYLQKNKNEWWFTDIRVTHIVIPQHQQDAKGVTCCQFKLSDERWCGWGWFLASPSHPDSDYSNFPFCLTGWPHYNSRTQWLLHCSVLHLHDKKKDSCGRAGKNVRLWDQLQSTGWDKSTIPCENCSHSKLWIGSSPHWFKLWLMELNKRPVLGTVAETHQTGPNWTGAELAWWYNRAMNYQGLFQLAWYALLLCYYTVCSVK